jgi:hypothetical protein
LNWGFVIEEAFVGVHQGAVPERCVECVLHPEQFPLALLFPLFFVLFVGLREENRKPFVLVCNCV